MINEIKEDTTNKIRELIRDYLNGEYKDAELMYTFDLEKCESCGNYVLQEDIHHTNGYGDICPSCVNDIDI